MSHYKKGCPCDSCSKIDLLRDLERQGIVRELCPTEQFWRFRVYQPDKLPENFKAEYQSLGEIRW